MPTDRRPLLDITGAADYLGVSVRHIRRLVAERRIPFIKWGSKLHFDPDEIDAWVDQHRQPQRDAGTAPLTLARAPGGGRGAVAGGRQSAGGEEQLRLTAP